MSAGGAELCDATPGEALLGTSTAQRAILILGLHILVPTKACVIPFPMG